MLESIEADYVMDYFQSQDFAKRRTGLLVFYFAVAVILIILSVYLAIA